jgi:uncharacterized membrane protein HdeD (DUF308 family)
MSTTPVRKSFLVAETVIARMWWPVLLKGIAIIAFALLAFFSLGGSLGAFTFLFAAYAITDGVVSVIGAFLGGGLAARNSLSLAGLASIAAGVAAGVWPDMTSPLLATIIGVWAVVRGALEFLSALRLRAFMHRDWSLAVIGVWSILFGGLLIARPGLDLSVLVRLVSGYSLIVGLLLIVLGVRFFRGLRT